MKKLFKLSFAAMMLALVAFSTTSCDTTPPPPGPDGPTEKDHLATAETASQVMKKGKVYLYGDVLWYNVNHDRSDVEMATVVLTEGTLECTAEDSYEGVGKAIKLALTASVAKDGKVKLHTGTYNVGTYDERKATAGLVLEAPEKETYPHLPMFVGSAYFEFAQVPDDSKLVPITKGTQAKVVITEKDGGVYTISAKVGEETFYFNGKVEADRYGIKKVEEIYAEEPAKGADIEIAFEEIQLEFKANTLGTFKDVVIVMIIDEDDGAKPQAHLYLTAPNSLKNPYGEYFFNYNRSTAYVGQQLDASGGSYNSNNPKSPFGCALKIGNDFYYLASGVVKITDDKKVTVECYSGKGTKITLKSNDTYIQQ